jgi:hypothetical protein
MTDTITESLEFMPADRPQDETPPSQYEYACLECGKELFYGGRGRHPKYCEAHKPAGSQTKRGKGSGSNAQLARQASEVLVQVNSFIAIGLMLPPPNPVSLPDTAAALAGANEGFAVAAYEALLTDPGLARLILRGGGASGKLALILAYTMLAGAVAPIGMQEYRNKHPKGADLRLVNDADRA